MFGDNPATYDLIQDLLDEFTLEDILEMNDMTEEDVLRILLEGGHLGEPQFLIEKYEVEETP